MKRREKCTFLASSKYSDLILPDLGVFFQALLESGIRKDDPRIDKMIQNIKDADLLDDFVWGSQHMYLEKETFKKYIGSSIGVVTKALKKQMIIPDWERFVGEMGEIFEECRGYTSGELATYIPQLSRVPPNSWAMSVCTIDGQRKSWGDALKPFCLQSVSKPFTYALVHDDIGPDALHAHVGQEPSGRLFNDISLDHNSEIHPFLETTHSHIPRETPQSTNQCWSHRGRVPSEEQSSPC